MKHAALTPLSAAASTTLAIPGSKSYTNRALLLAAMTDGTVILRNHLISDDTEAMLSCLKTLGISCIIQDDSITVKDNIADITDKMYTLNARISGTTLRFLLPFCCVIPGVKIIGGEEGLNKRPIAPLVEALRELGADIEYLEKDGFPPLKVTSSALTKQQVSMRGDISSQYFSALLMVAPLTNGLTISVLGEQISKPYIDMTISSMQAFGVRVENTNYQTYTVAKGQHYEATSYTIEGDFSSAGYFFAIAALTKSRLTLQNLSGNSAQADKRLLEVLAQMGSSLSTVDQAITIAGNGVQAKTIDVVSFPDQAQTLAVLAAFAKGTTVLTGVQSLRVKETERVVAVQQELAKMGIRTEATYDTVTIYGGEPRQAIIDTYGDHRMAMSFAIAGTVLPGMVINDPGVVSKTFPSFWDKLKTLGVGVTLYE